MTDQERIYVQDTIHILADYDGYRSAEDLMALIDEIRIRLIDLNNGNLDDRDDR